MDNITRLFIYLFPIFGFIAHLLSVDEWLKNRKKLEILNIIILIIAISIVISITIIYLNEVGVRW